MKDLAGRVVQSPIAGALVVLVLIVPVSVYLGTSTVRRGVLYYLEVFAPSVVLGVAVGLWAWSRKWFFYALLIGVALTALTQFILYLLLR